MLSADFPVPTKNSAWPQEAQQQKTGVSRLGLTHHTNKKQNQSQMSHLSISSCSMIRKNTPLRWCVSSSIIDTTAVCEALSCLRHSLELTSNINSTNSLHTNQNNSSVTRGTRRAKNRRTSNFSMSISTTPTQTSGVTVTAQHERKRTNCHLKIRCTKYLYRFSERTHSCPSGCECLVHYKLLSCTPR